MYHTCCADTEAIGATNAWVPPTQQAATVIVAVFMASEGQNREEGREGERERREKETLSVAARLGRDARLERSGAKSGGFGIEPGYHHESRPPR